MGSRLFKISIVVLWVIMMTWFAHREITATPTNTFGGEELLQDMGDEQGQEWFGVYMVGKNDKRFKIGFVVTESEKLKIGHLYTSKSWMRLKVQKETKTIRTESKILTDAQLQMINLNFVFSSDTIKFEVLGDVDGDNLNLLVKTAAGDTSQSIKLEKPPVLPDMIMKKAIAEGLEIGQTLDMPVFDPTTFAYSTAKIKVAEKKVREDGKIFWLLTSSFMGVETQSWVDNEGGTISQRAANIMTIRETKQEAMSGGWTGKSFQQDIIDQAKVKVSTPIKNPRDTQKVVMKLSGLSFDDFMLDGDRQQFDPATNTLTITKEKLDPSKTVILPVIDENMAEFLETTPMIQVTDPVIGKTARDIVGKQTDGQKAARAIADWVFENIEKKPLVSIPSARDVLDIKRGDCNEHASLYTALARVVKIPTKIVVGVVYQEGAFYYHAWNAVWIGQWVEIDPTFGQFPADATHVRLLEGDLDKQIVLLQAIGKLNIEMISSE